MNCRPKFVLLYCLIHFSSFAFSQNKQDEIRISDELQLIKISDHAFIHISYIPGENNNNIPCNGLLLYDQDRAFLFDTPINDSLTRILLSYIKDSLKLKVTGFISNDWHWDSMGGLAAIHESGIPSYAHEMTREIAKSKNLPVHRIGFKDSMQLKLGNLEILCLYLGPAHTMDNIVVWIPSENILFADCMIKELKSPDLGFTGDGDILAYPTTLQKLKNRFPHAKVVIPGHGEFSGTELIDHCIELANRK